MNTALITHGRRVRRKDSHDGNIHVVQTPFFYYQGRWWHGLTIGLDICQLTQDRIGDFDPRRVASIGDTDKHDALRTGARKVVGKGANGFPNSPWGITLQRLFELNMEVLAVREEAFQRLIIQYHPGAPARSNRRFRFSWIAVWSKGGARSSSASLT